MTQKKAKAEIPADMWLHVATDALARYMAGGGRLDAFETRDIFDGNGMPHSGNPMVVIVLKDIPKSDPRLAPAFVASLGVDHADPFERVDDRAAVEPVGIGEGVEHGGR